MKMLYVYAVLFSALIAATVAANFLDPYIQNNLVPALVDFCKVAFGALIGHIGTITLSKTDK